MAKKMQRTFMYTNTKVVSEDGTELVTVKLEGDLTERQALAKVKKSEDFKALALDEKSAANVTVDTELVLETREMTVEDFLKYSTVQAAKEEK